MSASDLVFVQSPATSGDLVFGEIEAGNSVATITGSFPPLTAAFSIVPVREATITGNFDPLTAAFEIAGVTTAEITGTFEPLTASIFIAPIVQAEITGAFQPLTAAMQAVYSSNTARPTVGQSASPWQKGTAFEAGAAIYEQVASSLPVGWHDGFTRGTFAPSGFEHRLPNVFVHDETRYSAPLQEGTGSHSGIGCTNQDADRSVRERTVGRFQDGTPLRYTSMQRHQDTDHTKRGWRTVQYQSATKHKGINYTGRPRSGTRFLLGRTGRFQDGRVPPPGISHWVAPTVPTIPPGDAALLFWDDDWSTGAALLFGQTPALPQAKEPIIVPVQRVYIVLNHVDLRRVSDNTAVPSLAFSVSLDASSWTWGFDASLPGVAQGLVEPTADGPVELEAVINGAVFRVLAESLSRERTFGQTSIKVSGRGCNAVLDAPYSAQQVFGNTQMRTSQQLMEDVLTLNGISLGYAIDYGLEPWEVPAGVFNHQGTYISALSALAKAGGGYLIPHRSNASFKVRHRYPVKPWEVAVPDIVLPADVVVRESTAWQERPAYNRVYVSGQGQGILGRVTRAGTAGEILAPMVTDALITTAAAARQRGLEVLGNTGRTREVGLGLPVLEDVGIIDPGTYVQYQDGSTSRIGIVRSTQVRVETAQVWQTIGVEFHA